jgi:hypothetical protein
MTSNTTMRYRLEETTTPAPPTLTHALHELTPSINVQPKYQPPCVCPVERSRQAQQLENRKNSDSCLGISIAPLKRFDHIKRTQRAD